MAASTALLTVDALGIPGAHAGRLVAPAPLVDSAFFAAGGRTIEGIVFRPRDGKPRGAIVLSMGVRAWHLESEQLHSLGGNFARAGVVLMALDSPGLRFDEVRPEQVEELVQAFIFLREQPFTDPERVGFLGFSVGGSLALLAASDERIRDTVAFVDVVGAHYDTRQLLKDITTGAATGFEPSETATAVMSKQVVDYATTGADRALLLAIFYQGFAEDRARLHELGDQAQAVVDLLDNRDEESFEPLLERVLRSPNDLGRLLALSPSHSAMASLRAPLRVLHSEADRHVPFAHALALVEAASHTKPDLLRFQAFEHVDPRLSRLRPALVIDALRLYWYLYTLVRRLE